MRSKGVLPKFSFMILALIVIGGFALSCDGDNVLTGPEVPGPEEPEPGNGEFDAETAAELMYLSLQAYQMLIDNNDGRTFTLPAPYEVRTILLTPEGFLGESLPLDVPIAYVATSGSDIYVVFRGTVTIDEWITDADFPLVDYVYGGEVEQGFSSLYDTLGVVSAVTDTAASGDYDNVYVTGHSLGAALAVLAIPDIIENTQFKNPVMYSFAGPRVGNSGFKALYDGYGIDSWRVFNTNDVVPMLPPASLSYTHVDTGFPITFGAPVTDPFDFHQIAINHSSCTYYATVCDLTADPSTCKQRAEGVDTCTFSGE